MKSDSRPVYLDPFRIYLPLAGWVSILHRVSGALLFFAFPLGVWALSVSLSDEAGFQRVLDWMAHPLNKLGVLLLVWAFVHHLLAGVRHLALDVHWGVERHQSRQTSMLVMMLAAMITLLAAWSLFA